MPTKEYSNNFTTLNRPVEGDKDPWAIANWRVSLSLAFLISVTLLRQALLYQGERWGPIAFFAVTLVWLIAVMECLEGIGWIHIKLPKFILPLVGTGVGLLAMGLVSNSAFMWVIPAIFMQFMRAPWQWAFASGLATVLASQAIAMLAVTADPALFARISLSGYFAISLFTLFFQAASSTRKALSRTTDILSTSLQSIGQGFLLVNESDEIITFNKKVLAMLDIPESFMLANPTLATLTQFQIERGDIDADYQPNLDLATSIEQDTDDKAATGHKLFTLKTVGGRYLGVQSYPGLSGYVVKTLTDFTRRPPVIE